MARQRQKTVAVSTGVLLVTDCKLTYVQYDGVECHNLGNMFRVAIENVGRDGAISNLHSSRD